MHARGTHASYVREHAAPSAKHRRGGEKGEFGNESVEISLEY